MNASDPVGHYVRSEGAAKEKLSLDEYPDVFPPGEKNCYDCKNFVLVNIRQDPQKPERKIGQMKCKLDNLLIENSKKLGEVRSAVFLWADDSQNRWRYTKSYRSKHWNYAQRCEDFNDMRGDDSESTNNSSCYHGS